MARYHDILQDGYPEILASAGDRDPALLLQRLICDQICENLDARPVRSVKRAPFRGTFCIKAASEAKHA